MTAQVADARVQPDLHPMSSVRACVAQVSAALDGLPDGDLPTDGRFVESLIGEVVEAERRMTELRLRLIRVAEAQDEASKVAASGTDAWLAHLVGSTRAQMAGGLWLARMLAEHYPTVRVAFARGDLDQDQAKVIIRAAEKVPSGVPHADRDQAVAALVERAVTERLEPGRLRRVARRMLDKIHPTAADQHQKTLLEAEEGRAAARTWFTLDDNGDGTWTGRFLIADLHAHLLRTTLEHLSSPRRLTHTHTGGARGNAVLDESAPTGLGRHDLLAHAFAELCEHLPTTGWTSHGRAGATVMIHLDHEHLLDGLGAARLDTGADITAGQARRLACNAGLIPAVLSGPSVALDLGRQTRLFTKTQAAAPPAPLGHLRRTALRLAPPARPRPRLRRHRPPRRHLDLPPTTTTPGTTPYTDSAHITVIPADPHRIPTQRRTRPLLSALGRAYAGHVTLVLLYDADCGFCLRSVEVGRRLGCRYDATPFQTWPHLAEHGITLEAATEALHAVDGDRVLVGHEAVAAGLRTSRYAVVRAAGRALGSRPVAPLGARAYRWVADHRGRLPGGTATCSVEENRR